MYFFRLTNDLPLTNYLTSMPLQACKKFTQKTTKNCNKDVYFLKTNLASSNVNSKEHSLNHPANETQQLYGPYAATAMQHLILAHDNK